MIGAKRVLAVIPARGGSKGLPRKNIRLVAGKPLIAYSIECARQSQYVDRIIVSSEDDEILDVAVRCGAEVLRRPRHLATDEAPGVATALHAIEALPGYDMAVLLQPTSPLRAAADIDGCIEQCLASGMTACVSVVEAEESPYWMFSLTEQQSLQPVVPLDDRPIGRRQDLPRAYLLNGAVYAAGCDWLTSHGTFVLPGIRGWVMSRQRSIDIDDQSDLDQFSRAIVQEGT
jgi:N-acylneuraminate cytidylyltransferase